MTAKAFWSAASDGLPKTRPACSASGFSALTVSCTLLLAAASASGPLACRLRNSVTVDRYSGKTWISEPEMSAGR